MRKSFIGLCAAALVVGLIASTAAWFRLRPFASPAAGPVIDGGGLESRVFSSEGAFGGNRISHDLRVDELAAQLQGDMLRIVVRGLSDGHPVPNIRVDVLGPGDERLSLGRTDSAGVLIGDGLPRSTVTLIATDGTSVSGTETLVWPFESNVVTVFVSQGATVEGVIVTDEEGTPLNPGSETYVAARRISLTESPVIKTVPLSSNGAFRIEGLEIGERYLFTVHNAAVVAPYDGGGGLVRIHGDRDDLVIRVHPVLAGLIRLIDPLDPFGSASLVARAREVDIDPVPDEQKGVWQPFGKVDFSRGGGAGVEWAREAISTGDLPVLGRFIDGQRGPILMSIKLPGYENIEVLVPLDVYSDNAVPPEVEVRLIRTAPGFGALAISAGPGMSLPLNVRRAGMLTLYPVDGAGSPLHFDLVSRIHDHLIIDPIPAGRYLWSFKLGSTGLEPNNGVGDELPFVEVRRGETAVIEPRYEDGRGVVTFRLESEDGRAYGSIFGVSLIRPDQVESFGPAGEVFAGRSRLQLVWDKAPYTHGGIPAGDYHIQVCSGFARIEEQLKPIRILAGEAVEISLVVTAVN